MLRKLQKNKIRDFQTPKAKAIAWVLQFILLIFVIFIPSFLDYSRYFVVSFIALIFIVGIVGIIIFEKINIGEDASQHGYNLLRAVIDNVPEQIYAHDKNGRYLLNNLRDAKAIGVDKPEVLVGKSDLDFYPPDLARKFLESERLIMETGIPIINFEDVITRADGTQNWISTTKTPLRDQNGKIVGIVGVSRDITERKQRERELEAIAMMSRSLRVADTSTELLGLIYQQVINALDNDFGSIELIDQNNGDAVIVYSFGMKNLGIGKRISPSEGLNQFIRSTRTPYLDNNIEGNKYLLDGMDRTICSAIAGAPMIAEDELIGFLWIGRKSPISEFEVNLLVAIADIAASSIHRMKLHELNVKQLNQLSSLRKIDISIISSTELKEIFGVILQQTCSQLEADAADILLPNTNKESFWYEIGHGFKTKTFNRHSININDGLYDFTAQSKNLIQINELSELGRMNPLAIASKREGFISYCAFPLVVKNELKGILEVFFRRIFKPDQEWIVFSETLAGQAAIAIEQVQLFNGLKISKSELLRAYDKTIEGWVKALDMRDKETEGHSLRVAELCVDLAIEYGIKDEELTHIRRGALLHDIGKVGIPDNILFKPTKLSDEEWEIMKTHPQSAYNMLSSIEYLVPAINIPYSHHEKWDGTGYPNKLKREEIPLAARLFSIVDVWDALSSDRPYRKAWPKDKVIKYIKEQSGIHFDPKVVETFLKIL